MAIYSHRMYKINDIDFKKKPSDTFNKEDGTKISFAQYYKDNYKI